MARETKTTFFLADSRRDHLKRIALARKTTVTGLLAEGADLIIAKYQRADDKVELERRGREAAEQMRKGFYSGPSYAQRIDEVVYGLSAKGRRRRIKRRGK